MASYKIAAVAILAVIISVFWLYTGRAAGEGQDAEATEEAASQKETEEALPFEPVLDDTTSATPRYLPVVFATHDRHAKEYAIACKACHHDMQAEDSKPGSCTGCHNKPDASMNLTAAMHASCRGCHMKHKAGHPDSTVPVECLGCHTERK